MTLDDIRPLFTELPADKQLPHPIVVLDTETTGFPLGMKKGHPDSRVIEFGAVALARDGVPCAILELLIRPHRFPAAGLWSGLIESGLTQELLERDGLSAAAAHERISEWWPTAPLHLAAAFVHGQITRPIPWVAFNSPFDAAILAQSEMLPPTFDNARPACIMLAAMDCMDASNALPRWGSGQPKWPTADEAMAFLQIDYPHPHRALPDAIGEALIACALARRGLTPWR